MPTYHVHSTTIKLYVWDPLQPPKVTKNQETPYASDVACRHDVEPLKEEYFEGQEGVDFLGSSMPFFLINAGRDLFFKTLQTSGGIPEVEALVDESQDGEVPVEEDLKPSGVPPSMHPKVIKPPTYVFDGPDSDSGLSSIPFPIFAGSNPLGNEDSTSQRKISSTSAQSVHLLKFVTNLRRRHEEIKTTRMAKVAPQASGQAPNSRFQADNECKTDQNSDRSDEEVLHEVYLHK
jgi:hypothetical protein